jgi:hypothetical protein
VRLSHEPAAATGTATWTLARNHTRTAQIKLIMMLL